MPENTYNVEEQSTRTLILRSLAGVVAMLAGFGLQSTVPTDPDGGSAVGLFAVMVLVAGLFWSVKYGVGALDRLILWWETREYREEPE